MCRKYILCIFGSALVKTTFMKRLLLLIVTVIFFGVGAQSQLLTWTPDFAKDNDNITITVDATKGNQGLNNYANMDDIYVHIGLITSASTNSDDWKHVPFAWATTPPTGKATFIGNNKYTYTINNIRTFFGAPAGDAIFRIAILFRNGAGTAVQRNADGSNMYVPVYTSNVATRITVPPFQPTYIPTPEP